MRTSLTDRLGIALPIIQAPMAGGWTMPALVAAVFEAGGLGTLAGARITAAELREQIAETRRLTARPFGVTILLAPATPAEDDDPSAPAVLGDLRRRLGLPPEPSPAPACVSADEGIEIALARRACSPAPASCWPWKAARRRATGGACCGRSRPRLR